MTFTTVDAPAHYAAIKRDRWGRYMIPHPITGKEQAWTRATTLANTLADRYGLEQWAKRNVVLGLGARPDLCAMAASSKPDDKDTLTKIVAQAEEAASSKAGANLGTALHRFTERLDAGEDVHAPPPWDKDVEAYRTAMSAHGIIVIQGWIERVLIVPEIDVAGTCDRLCQAGGWGPARIGDVKTGKDVVRYGMTEIALQLAIYSHATHWFDPTTGQTHEIDLPIDQEHAIVMHLPVGRGECTIYEVDIAAGWQAVQLAVDVRCWRQRKDLAQQMIPVGEPPICGNCGGSLEACEGACADLLEPLADQIEWVRQRVQIIKEAGYGSQLAALWSTHPDVPTFPKGGPTTVEQIDAIAAMCDQIEADNGLPFGATNPDYQPTTKSESRQTA